MSVEFKDYYAVLGVPRDADPDAIKQAFRRLARRYHPDVAKDKRQAEEKFKEINEAHEVLADPEKRKKYDELGADWEAGGSADARHRGARQAGPAEGPDVHFNGTGFSDFFERFFAREGHPPRPDGNWFDSEAPAHGRDSGPQRGYDIEGDILVSLAEAMHGTTRPLTLESVDQQTGAAETRSFSVRIPPGAAEGRRIRVPGKGGAGLAGGSSGDLYLRVRYAAHPDFRPRGADLYYDLDLAPWEAVLGVHVVVPSLAGSIKVRVPPGTGQGRQLRVRGYGLPKGRSGGRGDLHVVANIRIPPHLTADEQGLWERLAQTSRFKPRTAG
jgi:curved DNA-binding protein